MLTRRFHTVLENRLREKNPLIQILLGPRQVGKTTAAKAIYEALNLSWGKIFLEEGIL